MSTPGGAQPPSFETNNKAAGLCADATKGGRDLAEILQDDQSTRRLCRLFIGKFFEELGEEIPEYLCGLAIRLAEQNLNFIEAHCESPLEKIFFRDLQLNFLKNAPLSVTFMPPCDGDVESSINEHVSSSTAAYRNPNIDRDGPRFYEQFTIGFYHEFHIALQPSFRKFYPNGKSVRADALVWIPSNPACRVIVECDGFEWHGGKNSFVGDRLRDRRFMDKGYAVRRYGGPEVFKAVIASSYDLFEYLVDNFEFGETRRPKWEAEMALDA